MKYLRYLAEAMVNITITAVCAGVLVAVYYYGTQHITCVDFFQKLCVIH